MVSCLRILGIDPGLQKMGWGVIEWGIQPAVLGFGVLKTNPAEEMSQRLACLFEALGDVMSRYDLHEVAVEEIFLNTNPLSTLRLGQARGVALLVPALKGLPVFEYAATQIKKTVSGRGKGAKTQIAFMLGHLLKGAEDAKEDAADALAVAFCHGRNRVTAAILG